MFLRCDIENPAFDSQTKDFMNTPMAKFGSKCEVSDKFIDIFIVYCKKISHFVIFIQFLMLLSKKVKSLYISNPEIEIIEGYN